MLPLTLDYSILLAHFEYHVSLAVSTVSGFTHVCSAAIAIPSERSLSFPCSDRRSSSPWRCLASCVSPLRLSRQSCSPLKKKKAIWCSGREAIFHMRLEACVSPFHVTSDCHPASALGSSSLSGGNSVYLTLHLYLVHYAGSTGAHPPGRTFNKKSLYQGSLMDSGSQWPCPGSQDKN